MDTKLLYSILLALFLGLLPQALFAQEKTQSYYSTHESEILPDARESFQKGNYERAAELCRWHYIIVGSKDADLLQDMAKRCAQLKSDMTEYWAAGKTKEAEEAAKILLSINSNDAAAKELLAEIEKASTPAPADTVVVDVPVPEAPVTEVPVEEVPVTENSEVEPPVQEENPVVENPVVENPAVANPVVRDTVVTEMPIREELPIEQVVQETDPVVVPEIVAQEPAVPAKPVPGPDPEPRTMFVVKAGASVFDLSQLAQTVAPGASLGVYDVGGSPVGMEAGFYLCPGLSAQSASLFGLDASLVLRVAKGIYPKAGVGFFTCKATSGSGSETKGLCGGLGVTFLVGGHFCLEVGAKYYPKVSLLESEVVSTTPGATYEFPSVWQVFSSGIAPMVSIGWAF